MRCLLGVYPTAMEGSAAFGATPFVEVRAVILGQDPCFNPARTGLAFAVAGGTPTLPRSATSWMNSTRISTLSQAVTRPGWRAEPLGEWPPRGAGSAGCSPSRPRFPALMLW